MMITMTTFFAAAQIVNIPDANFKAFLLNDPAINTNADGEIQESEALGVIELQIENGNSITDITGIRAFSNLRTLVCQIISLPTLNLSGLANLTDFTGNADSITPDCFNGCNKLKIIRLSEVRGLYVNLGSLDSLQQLYFGTANVQTLDLSGCVALNYLHINSNSFRILKNLYLRGLQKLNAIDLTSAASPGLGGEVEFVDVTGCTNLSRLWIEDSKITSLDLSTCHNLRDFNFSSSVPCNLNFKNGSSVTQFTWFDPRSGSTICADDFEVNTLSDWYHLLREPSPVITSYCTFFPGGNYNTISGKARLDLSHNGCDNADIAMLNVALQINDGLGNLLTRYTASSGAYAHYTNKGVFTLTPYFPYPYFNISPSSTNVTFDTANNLLETRDFCITPNGTHNDLEITLLPTFPPARPGFDAAYTVTYKNRGTTTVSGNVQLNFDNSKMNFISASENVATQSTGQLTWNYNNLQPFEIKTINVTFNLLPPPINNIDDTLVYLAAITPSAGDETAFDNSFILPQRVIGSYDPNDKQCLEGSKLDISKIGDYLHYQIRFQNEGTDTAFNVVVADTLSDKLDWNSFEFIKASHPVDVRLTNNKAEFIFENIQLPYKAINEPASNGWVAFKIKPKPSVVIGDSLNNNAAIYFDFNLPVITNTATTIVSSASSPVPVKLEYFSVNIKEISNQLNWKASCTSTSATFVIERSDDGIRFSNIGNINATSLRCQLPFHFTDINPVAGKNYYRLKITDAEGKSFYSKVLVVGNNKAGLEIKAIADNTIYISSNKQQTVQMKVIAADGKEIWNERKVIVAGESNIGLQIKGAAKGIYTLLVYANEGEIMAKKFIQ
jgi:uncharacterized repeat protein (TIGR01451 family)